MTEAIPPHLEHWMIDPQLCTQLKLVIIAQTFNSLMINWKCLLHGEHFQNYSIYYPRRHD